MKQSKTGQDRDHLPGGGAGGGGAGGGGRDRSATESSLGSHGSEVSLHDVYRRLNQALQHAFMSSVPAASTAQARQMLTFDDVHWYLLDHLSYGELRELWDWACGKFQQSQHAMIGELLRVTGGGAEVTGKAPFEVTQLDMGCFARDERVARMSAFLAAQRSEAVFEGDQEQQLLMLACIRAVLTSYAEALKESFRRGRLPSSFPKACVDIFNAHVHLGLGSAADRLGQHFSDQRTTHKGQSYGLVGRGGAYRFMLRDGSEPRLIQPFFSTLTRVQVAVGRPDALLWGRGYPLEQDQLLRQLVTLYQAGVPHARNLHMSFSGDRETPYLFVNSMQRLGARPGVDFELATLQLIDDEAHLLQTIHVTVKLADFDEDGVATHQLIFGVESGHTVTWDVIEQVQDDAPQIRSVEEHQRRWDLMCPGLEGEGRWAASCEAGENRSQAALIQLRMLSEKKVDQARIRAWLGDDESLAVQAQGLLEQVMVHVEAVGRSSGRPVLPSKQYVNLVDAYCALHQDALGEHAQALHFLALCAADMRAAADERFFQLDAEETEKGADGLSTDRRYRELSPLIQSMAQRFESLDHQETIQTAIQQLIGIVLGSDPDKVSHGEQRYRMITDAEARHLAYPEGGVRTHLYHKNDPTRGGAIVGSAGVSAPEAEAAPAPVAPTAEQRVQADYEACVQAAKQALAGILNLTS